jgi:serine/threonine-protein kinase
MFAIQTGWLEFTDTQNHIKMRYPDTWTAGTEQGILIFKSPLADAADKFQENVNVVLQDLSSHPMTLEEFTTLSVEQYKQMKGTVEFISISDVTLAGQKTKKAVLKMNYYGTQLKLKQMWFVKKNTAYLITYTATEGEFGNYETEATNLMNSFTFTE